MCEKEGKKSAHTDYVEAGAERVAPSCSILATSDLNLWVFEFRTSRQLRLRSQLRNELVNLSCYSVRCWVGSVSAGSGLFALVWVFVLFVLRLLSWCGFFVVCGLVCCVGGGFGVCAARACDSLRTCSLALPHY
ncbi:MAG: hypothetical protein HCTETUND1_137 [Candidatus Hodgkinia cicadicola]|nr:MAG: hypothetical protein HCTETUND1_137 [Candidatus Hodgkinia cicadicola]